MLQCVTHGLLDCRSGGYGFEPRRPRSMEALGGQSVTPLASLRFLPAEGLFWAELVSPWSVAPLLGFKPGGVFGRLGRSIQGASSCRVRCPELVAVKIPTYCRYSADKEYALARLDGLATSSQPPWTHS